jgi:hypothetical protein
MWRSGFRGADEGLLGSENGLTIFGIVPMAAAVVAGLWMALH